MVNGIDAVAVAIDGEDDACMVGVVGVVTFSGSDDDEDDACMVVVVVGVVIFSGSDDED